MTWVRISYEHYAFVKSLHTKGQWTSIKVIRRDLYKQGKLIEERYYQLV